MAEEQLKPVMVVLPQKKVGDAACAMPYVVNGVTFDLSSPTHVIRLPTANKTSTPPVTTRSVAVATKKAHSHKEIERRRKLKITSAIEQLASCLPFKMLGRVRHGDVLKGAIDHIKKLTQENKELRVDSSSTESDLRATLASLRLENVLLKELHSIMTPSVQEDEAVSAITTSQGAQTWTVASLLSSKPSPSTNPPTNPPTTTGSIVQPWLREPPTERSPYGVRYKPYQTSSYQLYSEGPPTHSNDYSEQSRYMQDYHQGVAVSHDTQLMSRDPHVVSYESYPPQTSVWRPYSEPPHRLSGFGLSDILSHSQHSEQLEHPPPSSSFLVDSLLDDI